MQYRDILAGQTSNLPQNLAISVCYGSKTWRFITLTLLIENARQRHLDRTNIKPTTKSGHFYMLLWFRNVKIYYINLTYRKCKTETSRQAKRQTSNVPQNLAISICYDSETWRFIILTLVIEDARQRHLGRPDIKPATKSGHFYMLWFRKMKIYYINLTYRKCKTETSRQARRQTYHKIWPFLYVIMIQKREDLLY